MHNVEGRHNELEQFNFEWWALMAESITERIWLTTPWLTPAITNSFISSRP
jgi:hypothetical protein